MLSLATLGSGHAASAQELRIADPKAGDAILIMDYSNSMWGQINGVPKVEIARNIIDANFGNWNRLTNLGLMSYDHWYKNDCADIQLISPTGELDTSIADRFLAHAQTKGWTTLDSPIKQAASYFIANGKKAKIILPTVGTQAFKSDFSMGKTVTAAVHEKAVMSEIYVDSDASHLSGEKDPAAPSADQ